MLVTTNGVLSKISQASFNCVSDDVPFLVNERENNCA